jgi:hypothetical protein
MLSAQYLNLHFLDDLEDTMATYIGVHPRAIDDRGRWCNIHNHIYRYSSILCISGRTHIDGNRFRRQWLGRFLFDILIKEYNFLLDLL